MCDGVRSLDRSAGVVRVLVFATIVIGGALDARRRLPDLEPWHPLVPRDFRAADLTPQSTLADYLASEDAAFRVVHDQIEQRLDPAWRVAGEPLQPGRHFASRTTRHRLESLAGSLTAR